jgi:1,4-dihydroxy-2-naphthoate octaprenyltransferase
VLLAVLALPTLWSVLKVYNQPKPAVPPPWYPARGWPLWFVGFAFRHVRLAGFLLTIGLVLNVIVPVRLPLPWL